MDRLRRGRRRTHRPSAWDGYAATVITDAAVRSLESDGQVVTVGMKPRPAFYGGTV